MHLSNLLPILHPQQVVSLSPTRNVQYSTQFIAALSSYLHAENVKALAIQLESPSLVACCLLACNYLNVSVYLLDKTQPENIALIEDHIDYWLSDRHFETNKPFLDYQSFMTIAIPPIKDFKLNLQQAIYIQTSGSTGHSKLIHKSWQNLYNEAQMLESFFNEFQCDNVWGSVSAQHMYGLTFRIILPLILKIPINDITATYPEAVIHTARQYPNSLAILSPTILNAIFNSEIDKAPLNCLQFTSAGGHLPESTNSKISDELHKSVFEIYGSSETGVIAYKKYPQHWQFFPSVKCHHQNQTVQITSDWINEPEILNDYIEFTKQGFNLLGRSDRIIKIADKRISLIQIEEVALSSLYIKDIHCLTFGKQNRIMAWIALNERGIHQFCESGRKQFIFELSAFFKKHLDPIAFPRYWRFENQLPRDKQGKIQKSDLQKLTKPPKTVNWQPSNNTEGYQYQATIPLDLVYFSDHFASFPLVPGVIEIQWVIDALTTYKIINQAPIKMENIKFQQIMRPNQMIYLSYSINRKTHKITYQLSDPKNIFASGRLIFDEHGIL